jgi:VanZ family protein
VLSILGHWFEYLVLSLLLARALRQEEFPIKKALVWAFGLALTYGILDEFHQLFVLGREASLADVGLDAMGAISGSFLLFERFLRKFPEKFGQARRAFSDLS